MKINPLIKPASDRSLLIQFGSKISNRTHQLVSCYTDILLESYGPYIKSISPAYCSILIRLNKNIIIDEMHSKLKSLFKKQIKIDSPPPKTLKIPVCYEKEFSLDMDKVMMGKSISDILFGLVPTFIEGDKHIGNILGKFIKLIIDVKQRQYEEFKFGQGNDG